VSADVLSTAKNNLTLVDDALIAVSSIGLCALLAIAYAQQITDVWLRTSASYATLFGIAGCVMFLILGLVVRRRERKSLQLWQLMRRSTEARISALVSQSHFSLVDIRRAVNSINSAGLAHLILDEASDRLYDGRLASVVTLTHNCEGCGAPIEITVDVQATTGASCSYCHAPFPTESIQALRQQRQQAVSSQNTNSALQAIRQQAELTANIPAPKISVTTVLVLMVLFWPAAFFYVMRYLLSSKRHAARLEALSEVYQVGNY